MFDADHIVKQTSVRHVEYHETLDSTNKLAVELLPDLLPVCPALVITDCQTAGRGRGSNTWLSTEGALTFTVVVDSHALHLPPERLPQISLAAGLAVQIALQPLAASHKLSIKWPNDVLINGQKVCGILTEQHQSAGKSACVIGIGVNVNNSLRVIDEQFRIAATSLFDVTGETVDLTIVLVSILTELEHQVQQLASSPGDFFEQLNMHSFLNGRTITVETGNRQHEGVCLGLDEDGYLQLEVAGERTKIVAGSVVNWR